MNNKTLNIKYSKNHEWVMQLNNIYKIGITQYAQQQLGDIVYIEINEQKKIIKKNETFGVIESIKTVSDLISPITGIIININQTAINNPENINLNTYINNWIIEVQSEHTQDFNELMNLNSYKNFLNNISK